MTHQTEYELGLSTWAIRLGFNVKTLRGYRDKVYLLVGEAPYTKEQMIFILEKGGLNVASSGIGASKNKNVTRILNSCKQLTTL